MYLFPADDHPLPEAHLGTDDGLFRFPGNRLASTSTSRCRAWTCTAYLDKLSSDKLGEPSVAVRDRVEAAREVQRVRFERARGDGERPEGRRLTCNADMGPAEVRVYCEVDQAGKALLRAAMQQLHMSARAYHRILKLARTIADLAGSNGSEGSATIQTPHLAEAIQYRPRRQF